MFWTLWMQSGWSFVMQGSWMHWKGTVWNLPDLYYLEKLYTNLIKHLALLFLLCIDKTYLLFYSCTNIMIKYVLNFVNIPDLYYLRKMWPYLINITLEKCIYKLPLKKSLTPLFSIVNWQDFTSIFSCTNTMIQNVLNFVNAIWVKFCHARFLNALKGMLATQEWPSTAMLRHFIKPTVANVCATRAHLFAQNPLKVIFSSLISQP